MKNNIMEEIRTRQLPDKHRTDNIKNTDSYIKQNQTNPTNKPMMYSHVFSAFYLYRADSKIATVLVLSKLKKETQPHHNRNATF